MSQTGDIEAIEFSNHCSVYLEHRRRIDEQLAETFRRILAETIYPEGKEIKMPICYGKTEQDDR